MNCICVTCGTVKHAAPGNEKNIDESLCENGHDDWLEYRDIEQAIRYKDRDAKRYVHRAKKALGKSLEDLIDMMKEGNCI